MQAAASPLHAETNAFRLAEKKYKLYKGVQTDLSEVIDFGAATQALLERLEWGPERRIGYRLRRAELEGLVLLPGALLESDQRLWAHRCLARYPLGPHRSNLDPFYGPVGARIASLFPPLPTEPSPPALEPPSGAAPTPADLLKKLRWVTLGYQYNWTKRVYPDQALPFPPELAALAHSLAAPVASQFTAQAAIVNYYPLDGFLCGHLDDAEPCQEAPIVSISLGNSGVFLLGGPSRGTSPVALLVRSGDVVLMGGQTRRAYHGVPRVLADTCPPGLLQPDDPVSQFLRTARININVRQVLP